MILYSVAGSLTDCVKHTLFNKIWPKVHSCVTSQISRQLPVESRGWIPSMIDTQYQSTLKMQYQYYVSWYQYSLTAVVMNFMMIILRLKYLTDVAVLTL